MLLSIQTPCSWLLWKHVTGRRCEKCQEADTMRISSRIKKPKNKTQIDSWEWMLNEFVIWNQKNFWLTSQIRCRRCASGFCNLAMCSAFPPYNLKPTGLKASFKSKAEQKQLHSNVFMDPFPSYLSFSFLYIHVYLHLSLRALRRVHGREHHVPRRDRGGDGSHPAAARSPGAPGVRAALHVSFLNCQFLCFCKTTPNRMKVRFQWKIENTQPRMNQTTWEFFASSDHSILQHKVGSREWRREEWRLYMLK